MKKILIILMGVLLIYSEPVIAKNKTSNIKIAKSIKKAKKKAKKVVKKKTKKKVVKKKVTKKTKYNYRYNVGEIQSYAHSLVLEYGWSEEDYQALVLLWNRESSWNPYAVNGNACGIPQAKPCSKMAKFGRDYRTNWKTQVHWGLKYIKKRYGSPSGAWSHSQRKGWY